MQSLGGVAGALATCDQADLMDPVVAGAAIPEERLRFWLYRCRHRRHTAVELWCSRNTLTWLPPLPVVEGVTGVRSFCSDEPGAIYFDTTGATAATETACESLHPAAVESACDDPGGGHFRVYEKTLLFLFLLTLPFVHPAVEGDGVGYYAYLRSPLIDRNFQFSSDFKDPKNELLVDLSRQAFHPQPHHQDRSRCPTFIPSDQPSYAPLRRHDENVVVP